MVDSVIQIGAPFKLFNDIDGQPLEDGYIYVGESGLDPVSNSITVYIDAGLSVPIVQPIRTIGGYAVQAGTPVNLFIALGYYSITVLNKRGTLIYTNLSVTYQNFLSKVSFDSLQTALNSDLTGINSFETISFYSVSAPNPPKGGGLYYRDNAIGTASTIYADNSGGYDKNGNGFSLALDQTFTPYQFGAIFDGITDDSVYCQYCHDYAPGKVHYPGDKTAFFGSTVELSKEGQTILGAGWQTATSNTGGTRILTTADIVSFKLTANFITIEGILFDNTGASMNNSHVWCAGDSFPHIRNCRFRALSNTTASGGGIIIDNGAGAVGGSTALIEDVNVDHGVVKVLRNDVTIRGGFIWANSRPYAIYAAGSVGNLLIDGASVLPPQTTVAARKASIYLTGALSNPRIANVNFDGNSSLSTGPGLLAENALLGLSVQGCYAFGHNESVMIIDSCIAPIIEGCTFKNNNISGNGADDIVIRQNFGQPIEKPIIQGNTHIMTAAVSGTAGYAVNVVAGVSRNGIRIIDNSIHQPGAGGGYQDIEIFLADGAFANTLAGSLAGNRGTRRHYGYSGVLAYLSTDTFKTLSYGVTMAYAPRPDQISLITASAGAPPSMRFNSAGLPGISSAGIGFHGTFADGNLYWNVILQ